MSYVVPSAAIPARMGILLTLSLCLINTLNSAIRTSPKSGGGPNAHVKWILTCLIFITIPVIEYSWILLRTKFKKDAVNPKKQEQQLKSEDDRHKKLDKLMLIVSPLAFITFSIIFWNVC